MIIHCTYIQSCMYMYTWPFYLYLTQLYKHAWAQGTYWWFIPIYLNRALDIYLLHINPTPWWEGCTLPLGQNHCLLNYTEIQIHISKTRTLADWEQNKFFHIFSTFSLCGKCLHDPVFERVSNLHATLWHTTQCWISSVNLFYMFRIARVHGHHFTV